MRGLLLETRQIWLDHRGTRHDQDLVEITRQPQTAQEQQPREVRKRQQRALDVMLDPTDVLLAWPDDQPRSTPEIWRHGEDGTLRSSRHALQAFQRLEERGYGDLLLHRYPRRRHYVAAFLPLPFAAKQ